MGIPREPHIRKGISLPHKIPQGYSLGGGPVRFLMGYLYQGIFMGIPFGLPWGFPWGIPRAGCLS